MPPAEPRVSIIVRTKDRDRLLTRALDDLLSQTLEQWHAVVVNDGGDPALVDAAVAARATQFGDRITVLHNPASVGMEAASNLGLDQKRAEYVAIHDDDDTWAPEFLARTVAALDADQTAVGVAVPTEVVVEQIDGNTISELHRWMFVPPGDAVTIFDLLLSNRVVPIGLLIRRSALDQLGGFDAGLPVVGDWEFNLRLALAGPISYLAGDPLAYWHQRPAQGEGALANSVFGAKEAHFRFDRLVRDRALREDLSERGLGTLLYLSKFIDERVTTSENRILDQIRVSDEARAAQFDELKRWLGNEIHGQVAYHSPAATVKRAFRRIFKR